MVKPRSESELKLIKESGRISAVALKQVLNNIKVGVTGLELDKIAEDEIKRLGGQSSFKTVKDYNWTICITINEQVVHGIPTNRKIEEGDLVSIDLGTVYKGWHSDTAWSMVVGKNPAASKFLSVGEEALWLGIKQAVNGKTVGDIGCSIQSKVEGAGFSVVRSLVGHGVGKELHEEPEVPGFGKAGTGLILQTGMTLAIEVIYNQGGFEVVLEPDNWTISSKDKTLAGLFEMTIVVGKEPQVLTDWRKIP